MAKRALCVGINDYPIRGMDLKGCVNDAQDWARALRDHYDFAVRRHRRRARRRRDEAPDDDAVEDAGPQRAAG